jgi:hypothetical protein
MNPCENPSWWGLDNDFAWNHVRLAIRRHWNQVKQSVVRDVLNYRQNVLHDVTSGCGFEPVGLLSQCNFEDIEAACRFGYGARLEYGVEYPEWDDYLAVHLAKDWRKINSTGMEKWEQVRSAIYYGWNFDEREDMVKDWQ